MAQIAARDNRIDELLVHVKALNPASPNCDHRRDARTERLPSGISAGALAVTRALQQGHVARNNSTRVAIGLIGGMSI
jgi:hypothetical protein